MAKKTTFTPEQLKIIDRCKRDPLYFIENYLFIQAPSKGVFKFKLYPFQRDLVRELLGKNFLEQYKKGEFDIDKFNNIVKSRGMGVSTLMAGISLYLITFITGFNVAIVATDLDVAQGIYKKIDLMYENLPAFLKQSWKKRTQKELILRNQSGVKCYAHSKKKGVRSLHASWIIIDEAHFIEGMETLWETIEPAVDHGIKCVALSSPDYTEGWFYEIYLNSIKDKKDKDKIWSLIELPWYLHPDRQIKGKPNYEWRRKKDIQHGKRKASKEYDAKFSFSSDVFFEPEDLEFIEENMVKDPILKSGKLWIWKKPVKGRLYMVTVDCAEGGNDNNHLHVWDILNMEQVAEYVSNEDYITFGYFPSQIARKYNDALLVIERNSVGTAIIQRVIDDEYENLFIKGLGKNKDITEDKQERPGIRTTLRTRPLFINALKKFIQPENKEDRVIIRSKRLMQELKTFINKNGKPQAKTGRTDDGIMSMSFFCYLYSIEDFTEDPQNRADDYHDMMKQLNTKSDNQIIKHETAQAFETRKIEIQREKTKRRLGKQEYAKKQSMHKKLGVDTRSALMNADWL